jgi:hypothetical protein
LTSWLTIATYITFFVMVIIFDRGIYLTMTPKRCRRSILSSQYLWDEQLSKTE